MLEFKKPKKYIILYIFRQEEGSKAFLSISNITIAAPKLSKQGSEEEKEKFQWP